MTVSISTFDRLKSRGISAYKNGEYAVAKSFLIEAAECMIELAGGAKTGEARRQHEQLAAELIELAKDCDRMRGGGPKGPVGGGRIPGGRGGVRQRVREEDGGIEASDWIVREKPDVGFDDIAGLEDVKEDIRLKMIYPAAHPELAKKYGIGLGGGLLLYGPPGTGKTMIAKAVAHELEATYFLISPAQIMSKWVGEAEQNVRKLFDAAKAEKCAIIFIDEVEALVPKRQDDTSSVMQRVVPQILQELEGFDRTSERALLFLGATNKPWMLDDAMLRPGRLDSRVYIGLPDGPARFRLLEIHFGPKPLDEDVDFGVLCDRLEGYTGADIKAIARQAAAIPFTEAIGGRESRPIEMRDVLNVIEATPPSVNLASLARYEAFAATGA